MHEKQSVSYTSKIIFIDSVYFAVIGKSMAGAILPLAEPDWLYWSCDKDAWISISSLSRDL